VRQETGWFKGNDGKWRFEINDADAKLRPALKSLEGGGYDAKQIASVTYRKREDGTYDVTLNPPSPKQTSDFVTLTGISKGAMRAVLPDSVVASVDRNEGDDDLIGDFEEAKRINVPFEFGGFNALPLDNVIDHPALFAAYPALRDVMVQVDPKLGIGGSFSYVDHNDGTTSKVIRLGSARQLSTLLHEIQHGIQDIEGFASGGSPNEFRDESADAEMLRDGAILAVMMRSQGTIEKAKALFVQRFKREPAFGSESAALSGESPESMRARADNALAPHERYRRLAGEVEARNTQARQGMTDEQRRATPPSQTADVADSRVIVVFNGKEMANAPMPANAAPDSTQAAQPLRTPAATIRAAITRAYGKLLGQLEAKGLVTLAQTEAQAIEAAAQARAKKTGGDVAQIKRSLTAAMQGDTDLDVKRSANGAIQGFFDPQTGQSFLIADNLSAEAAPGVLMHEVGIHMAADGSMKALFNRAALMLKAQKADPFMRSVRARMDAAGETSGEEAAAYIAESYENDRANAPASVKRWLADLLAAVKAWMFKKGIMGADRLTVADIAAVARANARSMARAAVQHAARTEPGGVEVPAFMRASDDPDIRFARGAPVDAGREGWDMPAKPELDKLIYELHDGSIDLKRVQEAIKKTGADLDERFDARLAETLYPGRVAKRSENFLRSEVRPLLQAMALLKVDMTELGDYLIARHAPERNAQIAKINPDLPDGGAGQNSEGTLMTDDAAAEYLEAIPADKLRALQTLAAKVDAITAGTRKLWVSEGLEKPETVQAMERAYKHYVPLFKDEAEFSHPQGMGFSVRGAASKRAMGSTKEVTNVLAHVLMAREAAITRAEKNRVGMALYGMALSYPNPDFWTVIRPNMSNTAIASELNAMGVDPEMMGEGMSKAPTIRTIDPVTNTVVEHPNPAYKNMDNAMVIKVAGEDRVIVFNARNERAMRMVGNLKNLDGLTKLDLANSVLGKATRYIAAVNTQYNPVFGLVNIIRDVQGAVLNLSTTPIANKKRRVLADIPAALIGIARDLRGDERTEWSDLWQQYQEDGGQTGYREMFRAADDRAKAIEKELQAMDKSTPGKAAHAVLDLMDDFNTALENAVRLSAYKAALDSGQSRKEAARIGKELTVNFNRKGRSGRELQPAYAFLNASIQATTRMVETLRGPMGAKIIAGGLMLGAAQALMLAAAGFDDDDIPEWDKARALIIPVDFTSKRYIKIPIALGFNVIPNTGRVLTEIGLNGGKDAGAKVVSAIGEILGAMNPMGGGNVLTADGALKLIAPTVADPIIEVIANLNFAGGRIEREAMENDGRPGFQRARESTLRSATGQVYTGISKALNYASFGSAWEAGKVSPTPEMVRYVARVFGGGLLGEIERVIDAGANLATGKETKATRIPLTSRFYGEVDADQVEQRRFYEAARKIQRVERSVKAARKAGDGDEAERIAAENEVYQLAGQLEGIQNRLRMLNKRATETINNPAEIKEIDEARTEAMKRLNEEMQALEASRYGNTVGSRLRKMVAQP
jgi:hypothetical protein